MPREPVGEDRVVGNEPRVVGEDPLLRVGLDLAAEVGHHEGGAVVDAQERRTDGDLDRHRSSAEAREVGREDRGLAQFPPILGMQADSGNAMYR